MKRFFILIIGFVFGFSLLYSGKTLFAQDTTPPPPPEAVSEEKQTANEQCITHLSPFFDEQRNQFLQFMDQHFKNTLANSNLTDVALAEYKNYRARLYQKFYAVMSTASNQQILVDRLAELEICERRLKTELSIAEKTLRTHVRGTTNAKRTTALVEKLQAINSKLGGLNTSIAEMHGYMEVMANKIPYFVSACLKE